MEKDDRKSILVVNHRDLASPIGTTFYYYVSNELAASHDVHVVCRRRSDERDGASEHRAILHDVDTGDVPILSGVLFHCIATLYVAFLAVTNRFDVTVCSQSSMIEGWIGSLLSGSKFVVGLVSVPVRQTEDFRAASGAETSLRGEITMGLLSLYSRIVRVLLVRADDVVCLTDGIVEVTERVYGIDLSHAHVIGMGVDVETFSAPRRVESSGAPWTITYIGAVRTTRNLEQVIRAVASIDREITFRIAGQGPDDAVDSLHREAERLGVSDQVEWLGFVPHEEVPELLAATDFAVSPLPDIESYRISFPAKLLEYMAAGTVVVATDIPPHRKLIDDGVNGVLYDGSRTGLVEAITDCIDGGDGVREIGRRAIETAERHRWENVVGEFEEAILGTAPPDASDQTTRVASANHS